MLLFEEDLIYLYEKAGVIKIYLGWKGIGVVKTESLIFKREKSVI